MESQEQQPVSPLLNGLIPQNETNPESPLTSAALELGLSARTECFLLCGLASVGQCQMWEIEELSYSVILGLILPPSENFYILSCSTALKGNCDQRIKGKTQFHWLELQQNFSSKLLPPSHPTPSHPFPLHMHFK